MCQAAYDDDIHKLHKLISEDPKNINLRDEGTGDTPIIAACRRGHLRTVKYLLDYNANVAIRNKVLHEWKDLLAYKIVIFESWLL